METRDEARRAIAAAQRKERERARRAYLVRRGKEDAEERRLDREWSGEALYLCKGQP